MAPPSSHSALWRAMQPHTQLALLALSTQERRAARAGAIADLARRIDIDALAQYLAQQRLSLIVPRRLEALGQAEIARSLEDRLAASREEAVAGAKARWLLTDGILRHLEGVGIPALPLKGVELSLLLYGDAAARQSRDIDVLVSHRQLESSVTIARKEWGYALPADARGTDGLPLLHYRLEHPQGWPSLELHWRVHWYESRSGAEMLRESSITDGRRRMALPHELASLLLFYAREGFVGLRDLAAIAAWWDRYGSNLPAPGLAGFAQQFPELAPALTTAAAVAAELAGLPLAALRLDQRGVTVRARHAEHFADPQPGADASKLVADMAVVDLLLAPKLDLRGFVRRQLQLDDAYSHAQNAAGRGDERRARRLLIDRILWRAARMANGLVMARPTGLEVRG